jgi:hypothetical protein
MHSDSGAFFVLCQREPRLGIYGLVVEDRTLMTGSLDVHLIDSHTVTAIVCGTAKPCNPQGSQRLMGELEQNLHSPKCEKLENITVLTSFAAIDKFVMLSCRGGTQQ